MNLVINGATITGGAIQKAIVIADLNADHIASAIDIVNPLDAPDFSPAGSTRGLGFNSESQQFPTRTWRE